MAIKKILGLDISSTTIGYCILELDENTKLISYVASGFIKPIKEIKTKIEIKIPGKKSKFKTVTTEMNIFDRFDYVRTEINLILNKYKPNVIGLEMYSLFMANKSSAQSIIMLATFNRMVGLVCYDYLKSPPNMFNVLSIRHTLKKLLGISKKLPEKDEIPDYVSKILKITFPYVINNKGKVSVESYDIADGMAVAIHQAMNI